jgi:hypothetical protein
MRMSDRSLDRAHKHSSHHRAEIEASTRCGCFYCLSIFAPAEIVDWVDRVDERGTTARCARCGIDAVLGDASGYPISEEFLRQMRERWFGRR